MFKAVPKAAILSMVGPMALLLAGYLGWRFYGANALDTAYYALKQENIHISDRPTWLRSDVISEVFEQSGLDRMSLLDDQTSAVIAKAFDSHPWVKKTHRVHRMAGGQIVINAEFRQPIAMVHCQASLEQGLDAPPGSNDQESFLPVDGEGILLPTKDFSQDDIPNYILIYAQNIRASDYPRVGMILADPQIAEAILLCRFLAPMRAQGIAKLSSIYVYPNASGSTSRWRLEITTQGGPRILWGSAPSHEATSEPTANTKLKRLVELSRDSTKWAQAELDLTTNR
jgi:hypothetical protein